MNFDKVQVPKKISFCPIAEAIVELRFDTNFPADALFGIVFNKLKEKYPKPDKLPIMELPAFVRDSDPRFKYNPQYRLSTSINDFIFQIGPKSFSITCPKEYKGWKQYSEQINWIFNEIKILNFIEKPVRLGVRYINFFEDENIFEKIKINLSLADNPLISSKNFLRNEFDLKDFRCVIQLTNEAMLDGKIKGSSIDIDVIKENNISTILDDFENVIKSAHDVEKKIFFGILKEDFLNTLNPEY